MTCLGDVLWVSWAAHGQAKLKKRCDGLEEKEREGSVNAEQIRALEHQLMRVEEEFFSHQARVESKIRKAMALHEQLHAAVVTDDPLTNASSNVTLDLLTTLRDALTDAHTSCPSPQEAKDFRRQAHGAGTADVKALGDRNTLMKRRSQSPHAAKGAGSRGRPAFSTKVGGARSSVAVRPQSRGASNSGNGGSKGNSNAGRHSDPVRAQQAGGQREASGWTLGKTLINEYTNAVAKARASAEASRREAANAQKRLGDVRRQSQVFAKRCDHLQRRNEELEREVTALNASLARGESTCTDLEEDARTKGVKVRALERRLAEERDRTSRYNEQLKDIEEQFRAIHATKDEQVRSVGIAPPSAFLSA